MHISDFDLSDIVLSLTQLYGDDIENQQVIKAIIEHQYIRTKEVFNLRLLLYIMLYVLPFTVQLLLTNADATVRALIVLCCIGQSAMFYYEYIQLKLEGVGYFSWESHD